MIKSTEKFMDKISYIYDVISKPCSNERIEYLSKVIKENNSDTFLDMSCSTGETINRLSKICNNNLIGIDFSRKMIKVAKNKNKEYHNAKFYKCDMKQISKLNKNFDIIYTNSINWLPSVKDVERVFVEITKVLNNNGKVIIDIPNPEKFLTNPYPIFTNRYLNDKWVVLKNTQYLNKDNTKYNEVLEMLQTYTIINRTTKKQYSYSHLLHILNWRVDDMIDIANKFDLYIDSIIYDYSNEQYTDNTNSIQIVLKPLENNIDNQEIYIKEIRPEMTQCRIIQVEKKLKEKENE